MRGQQPLRADDHVSWLVIELAVYKYAMSSDSESASSDSPHANHTDPPTHSQHSPGLSNSSSDDDDIPLQQLLPGGGESTLTLGRSSSRQASQLSCRMAQIPCGSSCQGPRWTTGIGARADELPFARRQ